MQGEIVLINPWIYDFAAYDYWLKPYGLLRLGAILRSLGYALRLIDCLNPFHPDGSNEMEHKQPRRYREGHGEYRKEVIPLPSALSGITRKYRRYGIPIDVFRRDLRRCKNPQAFFVTSLMTYWYPGVWEAIRIVREEHPRVPVVLGGVYATLCHQHAVRAGADFTISGHGEDALPSLLETILGRQEKIEPEMRDGFPYPAFDLLDNPDQVPILTSRGCPFRCSYCASFILHGTYRQRDFRDVIEEIGYWRNSLGVRHFSFYDDALLVNPETMAVPMMEAIIRLKLDSEFHCPNGLHVRHITKRMGHLLRKANFRTIRLGFESSDPDRQAATGGKVVSEDLREAAANLASAGYEPEEIGIYILCGLPGQKVEEVLESVRYVGMCGAKPIITQYSPIPYTALWQTAVSVSPYPLLDEPLFQNNTLLPCGGDDITETSYQMLKRAARGQGAG